MHCETFSNVTFLLETNFDLEQPMEYLSCARARARSIIPQVSGLVDNGGVGEVSVLSGLHIWQKEA